MSNNNHDNHHARGSPFPHHFRIGTTLQNVFRNINHAFASHPDSGHAQRRDGGERDRTNNNTPPPESVNPVGSSHDARATNTANPSPSSAVPETSVHPPFPSAHADMPPPPQLDPQRDDDEDSMPDLRSLTDSDESDESFPTFNSVPPHQDMQLVEDDRDSVWTDDAGDPPPIPPVTGTRRARVDDDGDDARDRRHPSERVGGPPPPGDAAPQNANPQQPPRPPAGFFGALFGQGPHGGAAHVHTHTSQDTADPSPAGDNPTHGHAPRGAPILTAGFTLTVPFFGSPPGQPGQPDQRTGPAGGGGQGGAPGMFAMDAAAREELLASFAAFFQEFQGLDEAREDPERAKKLIAGLEVVPLGLVKRLERVGGAPGGHVGDSTTEGSSGCAICWDTLLDGESDSFTGRQFSGGQLPPPSTTGTDAVDGQNGTHTEHDTMAVDGPPVSGSQSEPGTSTTIPSSSEPAKIITLPCAHVFHASCLLPWFTRAKQATCPTCRFNIDPENLTYTPLPRRTFERGPAAQPNNAAPNPVPAVPLAVPQIPLDVPGVGVPAADAAVPPVGAAHATAGAHPAAAAPPPGPVQPPAGGPGAPPAGPGFNPLAPIPGMPILSFPTIQIPFRPPGATQAPEGGNQGIDVVTIGIDMFVGGSPPEERGADPRRNTDGADGADDGGAGTGPAGGNGAPNPNGLAQDLHSLIEGLLRTTRNIIPQVINAQGPAPAPDPAPAADAAAPSAEGAQPQPQDRRAPEGAGPQPVPPPMGGPRFVQFFPLRPNVVRPTRPMPPRRERKTWTLPPAPGPSLRQRVEQREREQGLRCSDTSCGVGPSDEEPYPEPWASLTKQVSIHPLPDDNHKSDGHASTCAHVFHPACLVSAERVAGWGGEDKTEPVVEVSCPVCRAVGCVTREEWESGVSAL